MTYGSLGTDHFPLSLALLFFDAERFGAFGAIGELLPRSLGPAATLSHMLERRRAALNPRLLDAGAIELECG